MTTALDPQQEVLNRALTLPNEASAMTIQNEDDHQRVCGIRKGWDTLEKEIEAHFEAMRKPAYDAYQAVLDKKKEAIAPITASKKIADNLIKDYRIDQERKRQAEQDRLNAIAKAEAEAAALAEAAELESLGDKEGAAEVVQAAISMPAPPVIVQKQVMTKGTGVSMVDRWTYEITDKSKIPPQYWILNETALAAAVRTTKERTSIPGIRAYNDPFMR
jgi:hypothetical protein